MYNIDDVVLNPYSFKSRDVYSLYRGLIIDVYIHFLTDQGIYLL